MIPLVQLQMSEIHVKWLSHILLSINFLYLPIYRKSTVQSREIEPVSSIKGSMSRVLRWKTRTTAIEESVQGWDVFTGLHRGGKCLCFHVNTRHLHRKAAQVPGTEKMKDLAEESSMSVPPRICSLKCIYVLPAFPLAISSLLLVDILQEFMEDGIMLDFY